MQEHTEDDDRVSFDEAYPPDVQEVIHAPVEDEDWLIELYENDGDEGAPWVLHEVGTDIQIFVGLSVEQKRNAHEAIHNRIHESGHGESSMFQ